MFKIVETQPTYCGITDGIIGSTTRVLPMTYCTEAFARKIAGILSEREYEACGDGHFEARSAEDPFRLRLPTFFGPTLADDDFPF